MSSERDNAVQGEAYIADMGTPINKADGMMRELGERTGLVTARMAQVECPRTRSALVVFEDLLTDDDDVHTLVTHMEQLCHGIDERMVGQRAQLAQFATDLRRNCRGARVAVFRDAYHARRRTRSL